ncbi:ABC transporter permease [Polaromonas sp. JS666]|uniref:ABC transporter permease n=1 Tax=Polaromonas sp. (strain JS666 / ATCC BAA-500) TaxID=296591 RepID=UPI0008819B17|nr:ABC transporter permease [Polaromonas sp. JS666]SDN89781.1 peptide/nickel transport system permease protein [Polaromonas sp. JS666]
MKTESLNPKEEGVGQAVPPPPQTPWSRIRKQFMLSKTATAALVVFALLFVVAWGAPVFSPQNPYDLAAVSIVDAELAPGARSEASGMLHVLGTDGAGRDLLSAIFYGLRISMAVGLLSAMAALCIGTTAGLAAAYFGGRVDAFLMRVVDLQLSLPAILVALVLLASLGQGVDKTLLALIIVQWAYYARNVRGAALVEQQKEYVEAAMGQGLPAGRIMFRHVLPNCMGTLIVTGTLQTAHAISLEATMSFLGIGLPQTEPSLGLLIANGFEYMLTNKYWISVYPGIALVLLVGSINLIGDRLRVVFNPKLDQV